MNVYSEKIPTEAILNDPKFTVFTDALREMEAPPFIVFFDKSNLDVTFNHMCNLKFMPGSIDRIALVSFDVEAKELFNRKYPNVPTYLADFSHVKKEIPTSLENRNYVIYQLILLHRTRIVRALIEHRINFWAMQQDSLWIENFAKMEIEQRYPKANLIFDTVGNDQVPAYLRMSGWICGSTFFVRANPTTAHFFDKIDLLMRSRQSPDSSIMTYLCGYKHYKCAKMPRWIISSSDYFLGLRQTVPLMLQVDSDQKKISKMDLFKREGFIFQRENGTCDYHAVSALRDSVRNAMQGQILPNFENRESLSDYLYYELKLLFNIDPYNNKKFLTVHYGLI